MIEYKVIPGLPVHIVAGSDGQIYNIKTDRLLGGAQNVSTNGYCQIFINHKGYLKHRLIALAFIPNIDNLPEVNHIDGIKTNCLPANLEWCSAQYNSQHMHTTGLRSYDISCAMCDINTHEVLECFTNTQEAQKYVNRPEKHGVWEALNNKNTKRSNGCAYGFYWERLNGEDVSKE